VRAEVAVRLGTMPATDGTIMQQWGLSIPVFASGDRQLCEPPR
jgi:hypothetical protein